MIGFVLALILPVVATATTPPIDVPMTAAHWQGAPDIDSPGAPSLAFVPHEGFPQGILVLKAGRAVLHGLQFNTGTIEYDVKPLSEDLPGIQFRRQGPEDALNAEEFYIRTFPDCRASDDCIQYAPVLHGRMLWNVYPQYQTHAFVLPGWNHVRLVISAHRMSVFINGFPAMQVGELEGLTAQGGIALRGPAAYANLVIKPGETDGLPDAPAQDPYADDRGVVRQWQLGPTTPWSAAQPVTWAQLPRSGAWRPVSAGRFALVNLNSQFPQSAAPAPVTWLRFHVNAAHAMSPRVQLGWLGQAWVFVNGRQAAEGKNFYYPEHERRSPDGRLALENGSFPLPLQAGDNEVVVALHEAVHDTPATMNHYGWGVAMRFTANTGLTLRP